jgi:hypothetical protein
LATEEGEIQVRRVAAACGIYLALTVVMFGRGVLCDMTHRVVGDQLADKTLYMWSFEWWPHALLHAHNPLDVDVAWAPHGFDFGLGTAGGGLALAAAPLTALVGPVAAYNVVILAAPVLAATTAYLVAHEVTAKFGPSLAAGYIFGFSSYELGHIIGHLPLSFTALIPLVPYLVVVRHKDKLSRISFVVLLAAILVAQFLVVTQLFFSLVLIGAVAATASTLLLGVQAARRTLVEAAAALLIASALLSPIVAYAFLSDAAAPLRSSFFEAADVLNYVVPTRRTWLRPPGSDAITDGFTATGAEQGAYLGLPFLVLASLALIGRRPSRARWLLASTLGAAVVLSFGSRLKVAGHVLVPGPWTVIGHLPIFGSALPVRMTVYTALLAGLLVALALADHPSVTRWMLVAAGVAATLPNLQLEQWSADVPRPLFFAQRQDIRYIRKDETVLVLPYGPAGWSMLWQAETGFRFHMVGGHFALRVTPSERKWRDVYETLGAGTLEPRRLCAFLIAHDVDVVLVAPGTRAAVGDLVRSAVPQDPRVVLDTLVYRLDPQWKRNAAACSA